MSNQLRRGIETLRQHYIQKLIEGGIYKASDLQLFSMTLSELEKIFEKEFPPKHKS
jgi:hypothetical protein